MTMEPLMPSEIERSSSDRTAWPLLPGERTWNPWQLFVVLLSASVATWCYTIGQFVGYYLPFWKGFITLTAGSMIGMLIVAVAVVPAATRLGIESIATVKSCLGSRGWMFAALLQYISIIGWNAILLIFFSKSLAQLLISMGWIPEAARGLAIPTFTTIAVLVVYLLLLRGLSGVERVSDILFIFIVTVGAWVVMMLFAQKGSELSFTLPPTPNPDPLWNYTTGIEIGVSTLLSWWPYIGAMVRVVPSASEATLPAMIGMGLPVPLVSTIGLATFLLFGDSDPGKWLLNLGGGMFGSIALLFVIAANFGTTVTGVYASSLGLKHLPLFQGLSWSKTTAIALAPVGIVGIVVPDLFFNNFANFVAFVGVMFAPLCGMQIVDYYLLRQQRLDVRAIYDAQPGSPYYFLGGFNPAAIVGLLAGFLTYIYLLNPVTYTSNAPYQYITASLPTCFVGALTYWLVTKFVCIPQGWGGYKRSKATLDQPAAES